MTLGSKNRAELVERALDGQSAEVKARVLAIIIRYDIDVRNEFFLIFVAIGHLLAIVEEAPENWRALFDEFERKLDEWSDLNLRTLAAIQQQGKETERMSQSFLKLTESLSLSNSKTSELHKTLKELTSTYSGLNMRLLSLEGESKTLSSDVRKLSNKFQATEGRLTDLGDRVEWMWSINGALAVVLVFSTGLFGWNILQQRATITEQNERLGWLLLKANREECWNGIKPVDDPICQQFLE